MDEDTDCQGDQQGTGQTQGGNDYFSVPGHTPVIFRCIFLFTILCLKSLLTATSSGVLICNGMRYLEFESVFED